MTDTKEATSSTWYNPVRRTTVLRHQLVIDKYEELCRVRVKGMRPSYQDILEMVQQTTGYAIGTIENIINRSGKKAY